MAKERKVRRVLRRDRRGFARMTQHNPFRSALDERHDEVLISYRPLGFRHDMITVRAWRDPSDSTEKVDVGWSVGGRIEGAVDDWTATLNFARAMFDAMLQAQLLRRDRGLPVGSSQVEEWRRKA